MPLDFRGFYLRGDGTKGSFAHLLDQLRSARIDGYEPLNVVVHDFIAPFTNGGTARLTLSNILNRPVSGKVDLSIGDLKVDAPATLDFAPYETKEVEIKATGAVNAENNYPLSFKFDAGGRRPGGARGKYPRQF